MKFLKNALLKQIIETQTGRNKTMLEDVFKEFLEVYKAKLQELTMYTVGNIVVLRIYKEKLPELTDKKFLGSKSNKVLCGEITLFLNTWKIIFQKTSDSCSISAIPDLPAFKNIDQKMIKEWELISESNERFSYSGQIFGKLMRRYVLEAIGEYPTKVMAIRRAIKSVLMSPEISGLYEDSKKIEL